MEAQRAMNDGFNNNGPLHSSGVHEKIRHFEDLFLNNDFVMDVDEADEENNANNNNNNNNNNNENGAAAAGANPNNIQNLGADYLNDENANHHHACWVFAYGSLCWYPGFTYSKCITGYIKGYVRRFWQGNISHRGTAEKPGRVATLVPDKEGITWGCAYRITGEAALDYLKQRECTLGGYATLETKFYPRVASYNTPFGGEAIPVLLYIATPDNSHWLGEDSKDSIATTIALCRGPSGYNAEYLLRLARFMHDEIPDAADEHLFELEHLVLKELKKHGIPVPTVMGSRDYGIIRRDSHEDLRRPISFEFSSRVVDRKLRCVNI